MFANLSGALANYQAAQNPLLKYPAIGINNPEFPTQQFYGQPSEVRPASMVDGKLFYPNFGLKVYTGNERRESSVYQKWADPAWAAENTEPYTDPVTGKVGFLIDPAKASDPKFKMVKDTSKPTYRDNTDFGNGLGTLGGLAGAAIGFALAGPLGLGAIGTGALAGGLSGLLSTGEISGALQGSALGALGGAATNYFNTGNLLGELNTAATTGATSAGTAVNAGAGLGNPAFDLGAGMPSINSGVTAGTSALAPELGGLLTPTAAAGAGVSGSGLGGLLAPGLGAAGAAAGAGALLSGANPGLGTGVVSTGTDLGAGMAGGGSGVGGVGTGATGAGASGAGSAGAGSAGAGISTGGAGTGLLGGAANAINGVLGTSLTGGSLLSGGLSLAGGLLNANAASDAARTSADAQIRAAQIAADAAKFRPVGVTTRFGESQFGYDANGNLISAGYELAPDIKAQQDRLLAGSNTALDQYLAAPGLTAPMQTAATNAMTLGNQYLATDPAAQAQIFYDQQMALLNPSNERALAELRANLAATGRGGLMTGGTSTMAAANPELNAYYNALLQQQNQLAANATQGGMDYAKFGAGMVGTGSDLMNAMYGTQTAAYDPYRTAFGGAQTLEATGQQAMDAGINIGAKGTAGSAAAGLLTAQGMQGAANTMQPANAFSPWGALLSGAGNMVGTNNNPAQAPQYRFDPFTGAAL